MEKSAPISPTSTRAHEAEAKEHQPVNTNNRNISKTVTNNPHEFHENEGYIIDDSEGGEGVRYAKDGHTRLIPQPSDDPNDPLNWSWKKKHIILLVVAAAAFLPDYGSATGAVTLQAQAE